MADTLICRSCGNTGRMFTGESCVCRVGRATQALATAMQAPPTDGERHDNWQYIAAYGYWVYMVSYDNWDDCAGLCEELCQRQGIGVWVDGARPGDYHPAANVSNTEAIRAIDANKG